MYNGNDIKSILSYFINMCKLSPTFPPIHNVSTPSSPTPFARRFRAFNLRPYGRAIFAPIFTPRSSYMLTLISRSTTISKTYRDWVLSVSPFLYISWGYFGAFLGTGEGQKTLYEDIGGILHYYSNFFLILKHGNRSSPYSRLCGYDEGYQKTLTLTLKIYSVYYFNSLAILELAFLIIIIIIIQLHCLYLFYLNK